ncbi:UNVERIFIED_CONTAM: hypothetical protein Sradi_6487100 [Sesamum radiatum]|uniref:AB hydrolase-1 domain-containing protein n=1 Tax=Sesamum radiatum TaxID=300843 RepID=A0AAW2JW06_SESRA
MSIRYGNHQLVLGSPPKPPKFSPNRKSLISVHFKGARQWDPSHISPSFSTKKPIWEHKILVRAASAASSAPLGGSDAEYSEQLLGPKLKQKTRQVAGIDQEEIEDPTVLADSDSCFCEFNGVQLHHKICDAELSAPDTIKEGSTSQSPKKFNFPMILLHGFGASVFSWNRVMKPLAQVTGSKVLAFDRPAFGLTSRMKHPSSSNQDSRPLNPYSMMFSVLATLYFIDFLAADKAILVGTYTNHWKIVRHSAGALVAVDAYFEAPERVAALILVAPAILAPLTMQNVIKENQPGTDNQIQGNSSDPNTSGNLFSRLCDKDDHDRFGIQAVRTAWYDSNQVSDHVVQGYTKPLKVKGWDKALVEYTVALLTDSTSKLKPPLAKRLSEISCPGFSSLN